MIDPRLILFGVGSLLFGALIIAQAMPGGEKGPTIAPAVAHWDGERSRQPNAPLPINPLVATILGRPLFSPDRRPPEAPRDTGADFKDKRFAGIVIEPDRRLAIFAVTGAKPIAVTEGDTVDGWRIESITADEIALVSAQGSRTLRLMPAPATGEGRTQRRKFAARSGTGAKQGAAAEAPQPEPRAPAAAARPASRTAGGVGAQPSANAPTSRTAEAPGAPQPSRASQPAAIAPTSRRFTPPPPEGQRNTQSSPTTAGSAGQRP